MAGKPTPRSVTTREKASRQKQWQPADLLPEPNPIDGMDFRWVRQANQGEHDPTNFSGSLKEGWEPCKLEDHPEITGTVLPGQKPSGMIEIGGLVLCKRPVEMGLQRTAYYKNRTKGQMTAVDNNLMRENDPRMPLFKERESTVKFGSGQ